MRNWTRCIKWSASNASQKWIIEAQPEWRYCDEKNINVLWINVSRVFRILMELKAVRYSHKELRVHLFGFFSREQSTKILYKRLQSYLHVATYQSYKDVALLCNHIWISVHTAFTRDRPGRSFNFGFPKGGTFEGIALSREALIKCIKKTSKYFQLVSLINQ